MKTRRLLSLITAAALAMALAGCSSSGESATWTYAPPPPATPTPAPIESAVASASAPASEGPAGAIYLAALTIQYATAELTAPADTAFTITFDNQDAGIPHNVEILDANSQSVFKGEIFNGPEKRDYPVPALPAGTYKFLCNVHPNMVGTLTVG